MGAGSNTKIIIVYNEAPPPNASTPPPPPNFMQNLMNWINLLYQPAITYTGNAGTDYEDLDDSLLYYTTEAFQAHYGYPYTGVWTTPNNIAVPSTITGIDDFVNCASNNQAAIGIFLQNMFADIGLPDAFQAAALKDLTSTVTAYLGGTASGFQRIQYDRIYRDPAKITPNYAIDAEWTWTTVDAVDYTKPNPTPIPTLFLRFVAVSYATTKP